MSLYAGAPALAALGAGVRVTAGIGALAVAFALGEPMIARGDGLMEQDVVRAVTVLGVSVIAAWAALLRDRLERGARRRQELAALLDAVVERAPIGIALFDRKLRYARVNARLAEIDGVSPADHVGRTVADVLPGIPDEVSRELRRVFETGRPSPDVEIAGETPAQPGARREWLMSAWPVRRADGEAFGVGAVVTEVTERRAAERALQAQTDRYETLLLALAEVGEGMLVVEDGRVVHANAAFEAMVGEVGSELQGADALLGLVVPEHRDLARRRLLEGVAGAEDELTIRHRDGHLVEVEVAAVPLDVDGRRQVVVVLRDITARKHAEAEREAARRRSAFLAELSQALDRTLDQQAILASAGRLCVREHADTCVILVGALPGTVRHAVAIARDERRQDALRAFQEDHPLPVDAHHPLGAVLRTGRSAVVESGEEAHAQSERHRELMDALDVSVSIIVPLTARGRTLGVMALGLAEETPGPRDGQLALFEDVARRTGLALDNARLYEERSEVARTLQRSLLPPELPHVPGVQLAARYVPAGEGNEVGGDFYDCFDAGGDEWALVIGDVCGKGAEAAAITALARYTIRAAVLHTRRPARVLAELNEAILRQGLDQRFCTVLYAALASDGDRVRVRVATGGHPLPLVLRANGGVQMAGRPGSLLGILPAPAISERELELGPGDALVLYTDGVIEASPADEAFGPERFAEFLGELAGADAAMIARRIEQEVLAHSEPRGTPRDDVAVLVVRVPPRAARAQSFQVEDRGVAASA